MHFDRLLREGLERLRISLPEADVAQLCRYVELLGKWNRSYNLTAVRDPGEVVTRHILDSLSILPWASEGTLLDVGAGAGLPGIPLAIASPELDVTLVDGAGKKVRFMNHVVRQLALANVHPLHVRVEELESDAPFNAITSRAFSSLEAFARAVRHLAGVQTSLLAMKGQFPREEIDALPDWVMVGSVEKIDVPGLHENRHLVIMSLDP